MEFTKEELRNRWNDIDLETAKRYARLGILEDVEKIIDERINNLVNVMHMIILQELKQSIAKLNHSQISDALNEKEGKRLSTVSRKQVRKLPHTDARKGKEIK